MTMVIVIKFTTVNTLFKMDDSFTPTHSSSISNMTIAKAKKSGYSDRKEMSMGMKERRALPMTFPINASI